MEKSPLGIKILSGFSFVAVVLYLVVAGIAFFGKDILSKIPNFGIEQSASGFFIFMGLIMVVLALIFLFIAFGLIKGMQSARVTLITISGIFIIGGVFSLVEENYISIINLVFNLTILLYLLLNKKVKRFFR